MKGRGLAVNFMQTAFDICPVPSPPPHPMFTESNSKQDRKIHRMIYAVKILTLNGCTFSVTIP